MQKKTYFAWINDAILDLLLRWSEMLAKVINRWIRFWWLTVSPARKHAFKINKRRQNYYLGQLGHPWVAAEVIKQMFLF